MNLHSKLWRPFSQSYTDAPALLLLCAMLPKQAWGTHKNSLQNLLYRSFCLFVWINRSTSTIESPVILQQGPGHVCPEADGLHGLEGEEGAEPVEQLRLEAVGVPDSQFNRNIFAGFCCLKKVCDMSELPIYRVKSHLDSYIRLTSVLDVPLACLSIS